MLSAAAMTISRGLTMALKWFCEWAGSPDEKALYELNKDFYPVSMDPATLTALVSAWQAGAISDQSLFSKLQQGEVIAPEVTIEQEDARKAAHPPPAPQPTNLPGPGGTGGAGA